MPKLFQSCGYGNANGRRHIKFYERAEFPYKQRFVNQ